MIVSTAVHGLGNHGRGRDAVALPFRRQIDGVAWGVVTDGHAALLWRDPDLDLEIGDVAIERVIPALDPAREAGRVWLTALLRWLNGQTLQDEKQCETCRGAGTHECDCGSGHQCGKCEGAGQIVTPRHADLAGKVIPLPRLASYLRAVIVESEVIVQPDASLGPLALFDAQDRWRMLIMPLRGATGDVTFADWTAAT
ncbi:hypothetical protein [Zavarzinia sp.]|jgi:hypothetical protein|uniref:hypothetical protein n=1 Tax=Zavarzinia sp. TaxID=2027920 RepID=UPI00356884AC